MQTHTQGIVLMIVLQNQNTLICASLEKVMNIKEIEEKNTENLCDGETQAKF